MDRVQLRLDILEYLQTYVITQTMLGRIIELNVSYTEYGKLIKPLNILTEEKAENFLKSEVANACENIKYSLFVKYNYGKFQYRHFTLTSKNDNNSDYVAFYLKDRFDKKMINNFEKHFPKIGVRFDQAMEFLKEDLTLQRAFDIAKEFLI